MLTHEVVGPVDQVEDEEGAGEEAAAQTIDGDGVACIALELVRICSVRLLILWVAQWW